jgi:Tfp pilus assembly protein PilE
MAAYEANTTRGATVARESLAGRKATTVRKATTTRALFLELVLDLVIFAVCAVICLQVFATAHLESARSAALSRLSIEAQEIAELFKSGETDAASLAAVLPQAHQEGDTVRWYYDQDLLATSDEDASFILTCAVDGSQPVGRAQITLDEGSTRLLSYDVRSYRGGAAGAGSGGAATAGAATAGPGSGGTATAGAGSGGTATAGGTGGGGS